MKTLRTLLAALGITKALTAIKTWLEKDGFVTLHSNL